MNIDFRCYRSSHVGEQHDVTWKPSIIMFWTQDPWMEYVDWDEVSFGMDRLVTRWLQVTKPSSYRNGVLTNRDQEIQGEG